MSDVLVDEPKYERRADHALAAETSTERRSAEDAIKKRELAFVPRADSLTCRNEGCKSASCRSRLSFVKD